MRAGTMTYNNSSRTSGFTMVELLIAIIIIGILVTIIVPVLTNRAADARLAAAQADMEAIANAESQVALDTGYIARLHVLDDSSAASDLRGSDDPLDVVDTILDEINNASAASPEQIFLDPVTGVPLPPAFWQKIEAGPDRVGWRGPYVSYQRKLRPTNPPTPFPPGMDWTYGSPLDPWGNPYFLFVAGVDTTTGGSGNGQWINEQLPGLLDNNFTYGGVSYPANRFDRNTVLSLGPNGVPGSGVAPTDQLGMGDDLVRSF